MHPEWSWSWMFPLLSSCNSSRFLFHWFLMHKQDKPLAGDFTPRRVYPSRASKLNFNMHLRGFCKGVTSSYFVAFFMILSLFFFSFCVIFLCLGAFSLCSSSWAPLTSLGSGRHRRFASSLAVFCFEVWNRWNQRHERFDGGSWHTLCVLQRRLLFKRIELGQVTMDDFDCLRHQIVTCALSCHFDNEGNELPWVSVGFSYGKSSESLTQSRLGIQGPRESKWSYMKLHEGPWIIGAFGSRRSVCERSDCNWQFLIFKAQFLIIDKAVPFPPKLGLCPLSFAELYLLVLLAFRLSCTQGRGPVGCYQTSFASKHIKSNQLHQ